MDGLDWTEYDLDEPSTVHLGGNPAWVVGPCRKLLQLVLQRHGSCSAAIEALERHGDDAFGPLPDDLALVRAFGIKGWLPIFRGVYLGLGTVVSMTWWGAEPARPSGAFPSAQRLCPACGGALPPAPGGASPGI